MKAYPYIKDSKKEEYYETIESFCENLGENYIKLKNY